MYDLERNNFDEYTLGEEDFEYYFELPNYFYNGKVENRTLIDRIKSTEIFLMKGLTGTGKTSICKKLAYMFSKEHSLYIDFSNIENRVLTNKVKNDLENLSQYLAKFKGRLILDNIESTKYSKQFSEYCCQLTLEYDIFIILITSNMKYELDKEYNHNLLCYDNTSVAQDFVTMNIENYLNTLIKKKLLDKNGTEHLIANKLYHTFKSSLSLLNAAFRHKHSINELSINDADEYIISSYHKLCTTPYDKKFLSYIFFFLKIEGILIIQKDILLKSFLQEFQILEKLVDIGFLKKDFEVDPVEVYIFTFEHKVMADIIFEHFYKENLNDTTIFLEDIKYLLESFYLMMPIMIRYHIGNNKHEVFMEILSNKLKESVSKKINTRTKLIISVVVDYLFIFDMLTKGNQLNVLHEQVNNKVELSDSSLIDVSSLFQETSRIHIYNNYFTYYSKIIDWKYNNISECINDLENETLQI
jgi:KaiC/GvpD/RAD55 family RecA-like ATPase